MPKTNELPHLTPAERRARGKAARVETPRSAQAALEPAAHRPDPVELLQRQAAVAGAGVGAAALRADGGLAVHLLPRRRTADGRRPGGDAPVGAAGAALRRRASVELRGRSVRRSARWCSTSTTSTRPPGPWEWDVKRLAASLEVAGRERLHRPRSARIVRWPAWRYRRDDARASPRMRNLDALVRRLDTEHIERPSTAPRRRLRKGPRSNLAKARTKDSMQAFEKLTDDRRRGAADHHRPTADRAGRGSGHGATRRQFTERLREHASRLPLGRCRRIAATCWSSSATSIGPQGRRGRQRRHPRLDRADAGSRRRRPAVPAGEGGPGVGPGGVRRRQRVRERGRAGRRRPAADAGGQRHLARLAARPRDRRHRARLLPAAAEGLEGIGRDRDDGAQGDGDLRAAVCAGRSPAPTPAPATGSRSPAYLGKGDVFDHAIDEFSEAYADQNERDYAALVEAIKSGRVTAETGL